MRLGKSLKNLAATGLLSAVVVLAGCQSGGQETVSTDPPQGTTTGGITTSQAPTPSAPGAPAVSSEAGISPEQVTVGNFVLTMAMEPAQHMFDVARQEDVTGDDKDKEKKDDQAQGIAVLGGMMLKVTNNIDAAQKPKEDASQGAVVRHVTVQIKDNASGQLAPYLTVSMDALRDGRPAFLDQALVPELPQGQDVSQLRYGNNVSFPRKGTYQLFIRVEANPILGSQVPPAAQFNLTFE